MCFCRRRRGPPSLSSRHRCRRLAVAVGSRRRSCSRCWSRRWRTGLRAVSPASVQDRLPVKSAPDDHFVAGPDCRVIDSGSGRVGGAGGCPTIGARIVSPASVQIAAGIVNSAPDDHFAAGPHCRVNVSGSGRVGGAGGCPTVVLGLYLPPVFKKCRHQFRPRRSFRCRSTLPCEVSASRAHWWCWWLSNCPCWDCISRRC